MYKYINLFSIAIFLTSTYILYANWTSKKNKKNTMMLMILITIIVYQISIIIKGFDTNLLQYNIKILVMLLILKLNLYTAELASYVDEKELTSEALETDCGVFEYL